MTAVQPPDVWLKEFLRGLDDIRSGRVKVTFLGQDHIKEQIEPFFELPQFPHTLITGEPGLGKTQLGRWIAYNAEAAFEEFLCPVTPEKLPNSGVVLLDEVHRQRNPEPLFPTMERNVTVTILGATTRPEKLEPAFASRFFQRLQLTRYSHEDMELVIRHLADEELDDETVRLLAGAAAGNPRQAERIMTTAKGLGTYDPAEVLRRCRITVEGFDDVQVNYMVTLDRMSRPVGAEQLAILMYVDVQLVQDRERLLVERGLVQLESNGRSLTRLGQRYVEAQKEAGWVT